MIVVPALLNFLDTVGLDVLHLHGDDWFYVRRSVPTLRTFHGSALSEARHAWRLRLRLRQLGTFPLELLAARLAFRSYAGSTDAARLYRTGGMLPYGVDIPIDVAGDRSAAPAILFVGTWEGRKRGRFLHELFQRSIRPAMPESELWMVSDRCEPGPGVRWLCNPEDEILVDLYRRAWVVCLPSTYEGFGIPCIEAMAHGTPVVASSNPGSELVLGGGRFGIIARDDELASTLLRVLSDGPLRDQLARAGRGRAEDFAWKRVVEAHESAYRDVIHEWDRERGAHGAAA
jgi:glycosyltransferase involved in cell wall biosynthesis